MHNQWKGVAKREQERAWLPVLELRKLWKRQYGQRALALLFRLCWCLKANICGSIYTAHGDSEGSSQNTQSKNREVIKFRERKFCLNVCLTAFFESIISPFMAPTEATLPLQPQPKQCALAWSSERPPHWIWWRISSFNHTDKHRPVHKIQIQTIQISGKVTSTIHPGWRQAQDNCSKTSWSYIQPHAPLVTSYA